MAIYSKKENLELVREKKFKYERDIQEMVEQNIGLLLNLEFVKTEFALNNFRIDTLAYDQDSKSFVIIEYKRDKNRSVVDQGYAYLSLMLNNKADFILEYNETQKDTLKRNSVDWSQSKVIFISTHFTNYQKEAINFKDLPIELWEIRQYANQTISFNQIQKANAIESIKTISKPTDENVDKVNKEIKVYTEDDHLEKATTKSKELYQKLREGILNLDDNVNPHPKKFTIGFKISNKIFCDVVIQAKQLKIYLNLKYGKLLDEKEISRDVSNVGHWGNGSYEIKMATDEQYEYILSLIKQSMKLNDSE